MFTFQSNEQNTFNYFMNFTNDYLLVNFESNQLSSNHFRYLFYFNRPVGTNISICKINIDDQFIGCLLNINKNDYSGDDTFFPPNSVSIIKSNFKIHRSIDHYLIFLSKSSVKLERSVFETTEEFEWCLIYSNFNGSQLKNNSNSLLIKDVEIVSKRKKNFLLFNLSQSVFPLIHSYEAFIFFTIEGCIIRLGSQFKKGLVFAHDFFNISIIKSKIYQNIFLNVNSFFIRIENDHKHSSNLLVEDCLICSNKAVYGGFLTLFPKRQHIM